MVYFRFANASDLKFLEEMLFEAFFWDTAWQRPTLAEFRDHPEFTKLLKDWGRKGDRAVIAEDRGIGVGAGWFRMWSEDGHSYGFVDGVTPEVALAVRWDYRRRGLGRRLLNTLVQIARADGFPGLSLSVSPLNPARHLYESVGFRKVGESGTSWTLLLDLKSADRSSRNRSDPEVPANESGDFTPARPSLGK